MEISRTVWNCPQLFRCSFSKQKKFHTNRLNRQTQHVAYIPHNKLDLPTSQTQKYSLSLVTCYEQTSFVSVWLGSLSTQPPTFPSWPSNVVVHLVGIGESSSTSSVRHTRQDNSAMTLDLFLTTSGDRPSYGAMVE